MDTARNPVHLELDVILSVASVRRITDPKMTAVARPVHSHRQNHAELCAAAHHARVGLGRFFERIGLNHGTHAG
jgi:hypothetical protein